MTIKTYIAMLHDGPTPTEEGQPVVCPFQPDGTPKPVLDHQGRIFHLMEMQGSADIFDYRLSPPN